MAYKTKLRTKIDPFTYDDFIKIIHDIETSFPVKFGRLPADIIWVMHDHIPSYFVKTTVSDLHDVEGVINLTVMTQFHDFANRIILKIREPHKKDFFGKIKFTPRNTLALTVIGAAPDGIWENDKTPILQNESYIIRECDAAYANDEEEVDYSEIMRNAWTFLEDDKRFATYPESMRRKPTGTKDLSYCVQEALCAFHDASEHYGICYEWNNALFVISVERENLKEIFKNRDKIDGRRRVLPVVVKEHTRNGATVEAHMRMGSNYVSIDGREFTFFMGAEDFGTILKSLRQKERMKEKIGNAEQMDFGGVGIYSV